MIRSNLSKDDCFRYAREQMVRNQLRARKITSPTVLDIMAAVPRERFVPSDLRSLAYDDRALAIGCNQTISQPYMVALMTEKLRLAPGHKVLEIGTGSGYQTAILARLSNRVYTVERVAELSQRAEQVLADLGISNVRFQVGDGTLGWQEEAPFDRMVVTAGSPQVPDSLTDQLAEGGIMIIPVGPEESQTLMRVRKSARGLTHEALIACRFVKLLGQHGWQEEC
jgi:protein-L-isoaspartate(D-aspartate) O-methyltransferase